MSSLASPLAHTGKQVQKHKCTHTMHPKISSKGKKKNNLISSTNLIERETDGRETHRLKDLNSRERTIFGSGFEQAVFKRLLKGNWEYKQWMFHSTQWL